MELPCLSSSKTFPSLQKENPDPISMHMGFKLLKGRDYICLVHLVPLMPRQILNQCFWIHEWSQRPLWPLWVFWLPKDFGAWLLCSWNPGLAGGWWMGGNWLCEAHRWVCLTYLTEGVGIHGMAIALRGGSQSAASLRHEWQVIFYSACSHPKLWVFRKPGHLAEDSA